MTPETPAEPSQAPLALDVNLEKARALHRVWMALNDGACPKCKKVVAATAVIRTTGRGSPQLQCPNLSCRFTITQDEIAEIERLFTPALDAAVAIFEDWREEWREQNPARVEQVRINSPHEIRSKRGYPQ